MCCGRGVAGVLRRGGGGGGGGGEGWCKMRTGREIKTKPMNGSRNRNRIIYQSCTYSDRRRARVLYSHTHPTHQQQN